MFTGLISDIGTIASLTPFGDGMRLSIDCAYDASEIALGASIACAGACLTAIAIEPREGGARFSVEASGETLEKTTLGAYAVGDRLNLERSLRLGDELGGHLVSGHVDGVARIVSREDGADMSVFRFEAPAALRGLIAAKGSIALDGTSLTVNEAGETFTVALIPHTLKVTTWDARQRGDSVNLEVDMLARYVARLIEVRGAIA